MVAIMMMDRNQAVTWYCHSLAMECFQVVENQAATCCHSLAMECFQVVEENQSRWHRCLSKRIESGDADLRRVVRRVVRLVVVHRVVVQ